MRRADVMRHWGTRLDDVLGGHPVSGSDTAADKAIEGADAAPLPAVDRLSVHHAGAPCPAGALAPDPDRFDGDGRFIEATFTATREVALVALRSAPTPDGVSPSGSPEAVLPGGSPTGSGRFGPVGMVEAVLGATENLRWGVAAWIEEADRAALATLRNAAVAWVTDALGLAARHGNPDWQAPTAMRFDPRGRGVQLTATVDAVRVTGSGTHLFVMRRRAATTDTRVAGRIALMRALSAGQVATSVVLGFRDSLHRITFPVTGELLEAALQDAAEDIRRARRPSLAPRVAGPQCRYCVLLAQCPQGTGHLAAGRGVMG